MLKSEDLLHNQEDSPISDYSQSIDFSDKDALASGNASKVAKGADIDTELDLISTAIATKYDSNDLASQVQAEAESSNAVLITPLRLANWADENGGFVGELQEIADQSADGLVGWDDSAAADSNVILFTAGTALAFSTTTIEMSHLGFEDLADPNADRIAYWDDSAAKFDWLVVNAPLTISGLNLDISTATAIAEGVSELSTDAETNTGTATDRVVTPANLAQATSLLAATATQKGAVELLTDAETNTGTDTTRAMTAANLAQATSLLQATATQKGAVEIATQAEVDAGSDTARVITPATLNGGRKVKSADDIAQSDSTFTDDTHLNGFVLNTGKLYSVKGMLRYNQNVGNIKFIFDFSQPPAENGIVHWAFESDSDDTLIRAAAVTLEVIATTMTDTDEVAVIISGIFQANATAGGDVSLQFAQNLVSSNATTLRTGSHLTFTQLD